MLLELELWQASSVSITFTFLLDFFRKVFLWGVSLITLRVFSFSFFYIEKNSSFNKFHLILRAFVFSMFFLILSPNLIRLIVGWDGLGVSSFFLVIFYSSSKSFNAGLITALSNRVGDAFILVSIVRGLSSTSFSLFLITKTAFFPRVSLKTILLLAALTKRAQIPFSAWLPAAMAAPTPVSSLVHSSTLVTAGIYLLVRLLPLLSSENHIIGLIGWTGAITITIARFRALLEADIKKIVALSTLSQLGVIIIALRTKNEAVVLFHLIAHAFFKALLFIRAGNIIHNAEDYQDLRRMGGLGQEIPLSKAVVIFTKISLCGLPFCSAFFSKELVLERLAANTISRFFTYLLIWSGVTLTCIYSLRFIYYVFLSTPKINSFNSKSDARAWLTLGIALLLIPRITGGKFLFYALYPYFFTPLTSLRAKLITLSAVFFLRRLVFIFFSPRRQFRLLPSFFYMWLLGKWRGSFLLKNSTFINQRQRWLTLFSLIDYSLGQWINPISSIYLSPIFFKRVPFLKTIFSFLFFMIVLRL